MRYRRAYAAGSTFFFTVNLVDRDSSLLIEHLDALRDAVKTIRDSHPFEIVAMSVMPEHLHAILTLPSDDRNYAFVGR